MNRSRVLPLLLAAFAISTASCTLVFSPEIFQSLRMVFKLTEGIDQDSKTAVQSLFFPGAVVTKGKFVRVSGQLVPPDEGELPDEILLVARTVNADTGALRHRFKLTLTIDAEGRFERSKKFKKNIRVDSLMTVTAEPKGAALAADTQVTICVDMVKDKSQLAALPECIDDGGGGGESTTLSTIQDEIFTPTCALAGCHDSGSSSAGLVLQAGRSFDELVGVPSNQQPLLQRVSPGLPDSSYLLDKLRGAAGISGQRMPIGGPLLADEQLDGIVQWIEDGAEDN